MDTDTACLRWTNPILFEKRVDRLREHERLDMQCIQANGEILTIHGIAVKGSCGILV